MERSLRRDDACLPLDKRHRNVPPNLVRGVRRVDKVRPLTDAGIQLLLLRRRRLALFAGLCRRLVGRLLPLELARHLRRRSSSDMSEREAWNPSPASLSSHQAHLRIGLDLHVGGLAHARALDRSVRVAPAALVDLRAERHSI